MEKSLRSLGKTFVAVGTPYPLFNTMGGLEFSFVQQLVVYVSNYYPPCQVLPHLIVILQCINITSLNLKPTQAINYGPHVGYIIFPPTPIKILQRWN